MLYMVVAVLGLGVIVARRYLRVLGQAELGGPPTMKKVSCAFLVTLWLVFVIISTLKAYGVISNPFY